MITRENGNPSSIKKDTLGEHKVGDSSGPVWQQLCPVVPLSASELKLINPLIDGEHAETTVGSSPMHPFDAHAEPQPV